MVPDWYRALAKAARLLGFRHAAGGIRTHTSSRTMDFESTASAVPPPPRSGQGKRPHSSTSATSSLSSPAGAATIPACIVASGRQLADLQPSPPRDQRARRDIPALDASLVVRIEAPACRPGEIEGGGSHPANVAHPAVAHAPRPRPGEPGRPSRSRTPLPPSRSRAPQSRRLRSTDRSRSASLTVSRRSTRRGPGRAPLPPPPRPHPRTRCLPRRLGSRTGSSRCRRADRPARAGRRQRSRHLVRRGRLARRGRLVHRRHPARRGRLLRRGPRRGDAAWRGHPGSRTPPPHLRRRRDRSASSSSAPRSRAGQSGHSALGRQPAPPRSQPRAAPVPHCQPAVTRMRLSAPNASAADCRVPGEVSQPGRWN